MKVLGRTFFRAVAVVVSCWSLAGLAQSSSVKAQDTAALSAQVKSVEQTLGARVGVSVFIPSQGVVWNYHGDQRFPMMSTFKTLACAKMLSDVDAGKLALNDTVKVRSEELMEYSPVLRPLVGTDITLQAACQATMETSDNTAANLVLEKIGGPVALTAYLKSIGDNVTRLDRNEPTLNEAAKNDPRDTTTPNAINHTLNTLVLGETLSSASRQQLKTWMQDNKVADGLLRSVLPQGFQIADRSGAGGFGSRGITALVWSAQQEPMFFSIYLTQTEATFDERNAAIVTIGKSIFDTFLTR
ncbi:class A beta-lactamase [Plesiomonas shigelloides]|uniref:class A beta-lactamase n=1 Tax=Plesiomonas shigelloides TaxID=703 RepID=UPI00387F00EA